MTIAALNYHVCRYGRLVAGVDEAGRGPLAGPVTAAAVILDPRRKIEGLADSKSLGADRRLALEAQIKSQALAWGVGRAEVWEIDALNILQASLLAMQRAVEALPLSPDYVLVDGKFSPPVVCRSVTIIKGDQTISAICAASILAKAARDREMESLDRQFPGYGFARHKGYPTRAHLQALRTLGTTSIHRMSFAPVRACHEATSD